MKDPKELIEECKKHLRSTASFKHEYKKDIRKLITALEKAINYSQCCKSDSEQLCEHPMSERADIVGSSRTYCLKCSTTL